MATTIRIQDWTKKQLDKIIEEEDHASFDSAIKSLLKDQTIAQHMTLRDHSDNRGIDSDHQSLAATDSLSAEEGTNIWGPEVYLGALGAGKTVTAAYQAHHVLESDPVSTVIIMDCLGQYEHFTATHSGEHIQLTDPADVADQSDRLSSNHLLCYDLESRLLQSEPAVLETMVENVYEQAGLVDGRAVLLFDDAYPFLEADASAQRLRQLFRHSRQQEISIRLVSQSVGGLNDVITDCVSLATRVYLHHLPAVEPDFAAQLDLTAHQQDYIKSAETGAAGESPEVLVREMSTGWQPYTVDIAPDVLAQLVETPPER
jgi:hypothetical protein